MGVKKAATQNGGIMSTQEGSCKQLTGNGRSNSLFCRTHQSELPIALWISKREFNPA